MADDIIKEQIKEATDILSVIGQFVTLKKRGANWLGLCPFHTEKTPSFNVHPTRQFFHCFGCGKGGDVFSFLMEHEGWSFPEALKYCADRAGIRLPTRDDHDDERSTQRRAMQAALSLADAVYRRTLFSPEGNAALDYLHQRGFEDAVLKTSGVGYAPNSYDRLLKAAKAQGISEKALQAAGLIGISQKSGQPYDRFRNRVTFPIQSLSGHTVAFGARALAADDEPKYLNSPETDLYHKGRILYGLSWSREAIRRADCALIVEGYLDWLRLFASGLDNVVAVSGTAMTDHQAVLLSRFCRRIILIFDADSAGQRAALRGIEVAFNAGVGVDVVELPSGDDPDTFVRRESAEKLRAMIDAAPTIVEYRVRQARQRDGRFDFLAREQLTKELAELARRLDDADRRETFIGEAAGFLEIDEAHFRQSVGSRSATTSVGGQSPLRIRQIPTRDEELLRILADDPERVAQAREAIVPDDFRQSLHRRMYAALLEWEAKGDARPSPEQLGRQPDEIAEWSRLFAYDTNPDAAQQVFRDALGEFSRRHRAVPRLKSLIAQAEKAGDTQTANRLTEELAAQMRLDTRDDPADKATTAAGVQSR